MFTEEYILEKFNGDKEKANQFMEALIKSQKATAKEMGPAFWKNIEDELSKNIEVSFMPWWKRFLIKLKIIQK